LSRAYATPKIAPFWHVQHEADGSPVVAARHELAQDLDVVVLRVKERLSSGCSSVITAVATAPAAAPRKLVCSTGQACQGFCAGATDADQRLERRYAPR
jgi:hypothetical protein